MDKIIVSQEQAGKRIDKFLAREFFLPRKTMSWGKYSRAEISKKIKNGEVLVNGKKIKSMYALAENDIVELENFSKEVGEEKLIGNGELKLEVLFENKNIIVINKQPGISMHPSANEKLNTITNALVAKYPEIRDVHDESAEGRFRPGIVHRLDKDTSGVMVIARNQKTLNELKKLFAGRLVEKKYVAICEGIFTEKEGVVEKSLARSASYRKQVIARKNTKTKIREAVTRYKVTEEHGGYSLVEASPKTGRTHQIRIHLASIGHPIVGDLVYNSNVQKEKQLGVKRQLLHAKELKFELFGEKYDFSVPIPADFEKFLASIDPAPK